MCFRNLSLFPSQRIFTSVNKRKEKEVSICLSDVCGWCIFSAIGWFVAVQNEYCTQEIGGKDGSETIDCSAVECQKFKTFENIKIDLKQQNNQVTGCWMMGNGHLSV
jgi:hypothetical protein